MRTGEERPTAAFTAAIASATRNNNPDEDEVNLENEPRNDELSNHHRCEARAGPTCLEKFPWNQNSITANTFELELLAGFFEETSRAGSRFAAMMVHNSSFLGSFSRFTSSGLLFRVAVATAAVNAAVVLRLCASTLHPLRLARLFHSSLHS